MTRKPAARGGGCLRWLGGGAVTTILLSLVALAYAAYQGLPPFAGEGAAPAARPAAPAAPADATAQRGRTAMSAGLIKAYFTTPTLVYPDRPNQRRDPPLLTAALDDIAAARERVDLAVFDLDLEPLAQALIAAHSRGVQVRVVIDSVNLEAPEVSAIAGELERGGVPITYDQREPFMHHKFIVVDRRIVWLGSWNMTENDTYRNNNNMLRLRSQLAAEAFTQEFDQLFGGVFGTSKTAYEHPQVRLDTTPIDIYFSPEDRPAQPLLSEIERAKRSIRFMAFSFTSDDVAQAMIERQRAGVTVQGVMETQNVAGTGAVFAQLKRGGVEVLEDGNCYIMHHKVIIIDDQVVVTGSYNFTNSAERSNDEHLVIIADRELAAAFIAEFDRVLEQARSPARCG